MSNSRKWLFLAEYKQVVKAAQRSKHALRNQAIVRLSTAHGLRVSELIDLTWHDIDLKHATVFISRKKDSISSTHHLEGWETNILRRLKSKYNSLWIVCSPKGEKLDRKQVNYVCDVIQKQVDIGIKLTPHTFRHTCGYLMAQNGFDLFAIKSHLGHANVSNTMLYFQGYKGSDRGGRVSW